MTKLNKYRQRKTEIEMKTVSKRQYLKKKNIVELNE